MDKLTRIPKGQGNAKLVIDHALVAKVTCDDTNGAYALGEIIVPPKSSPPLHKHESLESFYILQGSFEFDTIENDVLKTTQAHVGDTIHVPSGVAHTFRNVGTQEGKMLGIVQPGEMARFFDKIGKPYHGEKLEAKKRPSLISLVKIGFLAKKYGIKFVRSPKKSTKI